MQFTFKNVINRRGEGAGGSAHKLLKAKNILLAHTGFCNICWSVFYWGGHF